MGRPAYPCELQKLGFTVSERTVSRYMLKRLAEPEVIERWRIFLRNHRECIAAMDFFTVPAATFQVLYVLLFTRHAERQILHFNVSAHPGTEWVIQQLREAFPYDTAPRYLIFDRDDKFGQSVVAAMKAMGIRPSRTAFRSPWQNGVAEPWIGSVRRELQNHVVILNEPHLRRLLNDYVRYYHADRTRLGLQKDSPLRRDLIAKARPEREARFLAPGRRPAPPV